MTLPAVSAAAATQAAVYARLAGDLALAAMVTGVFDHVPEGTLRPYVEIGEMIETPENNHGQIGRNQVITLHIWSDHRGYTQANSIADRLHELLDHQPLDVAGQHHVYTHYEFSQTLRDPDPEIRHIPVRFRVVTEQEP